MEKVIIDFRMNSLDNKVEFTTIGEFDKHELKFIDNEETDHYIIFKNDTVEYYKKGLMDMKFIFDLKNNTKGIYKVDNNPFVFDIVTTKLESNGNRLVIKYNLIQDNEIINQSELNIKYSVTKEE